MYCRKTLTAMWQVLLLPVQLVMLQFQTVGLPHTLQRSFLTVGLENLGVDHSHPPVRGVNRFQLVGHSTAYLFTVTNHFCQIVIGLFMQSQPVSPSFVRIVAMWAQWRPQKIHLVGKNCFIQAPVALCCFQTPTILVNRMPLFVIVHQMTEIQQWLRR